MFSEMLKLYILFIFVLNVVCVHRIKRSDIDLQICIDNFNIHKDKIIRTQDSQNMGAKYLNEIDLGSREECLRLCCETENCDVFVFEEKNAGSCYLFHCGPPEDFKCKFTHHVNYSSGVLAINRHLPDLESQIKLTKHEQDLTKLRKPEVEPEVIVAAKTTASTTTTTVNTKEVLPSLTKIKTPEEARKCSRNQFECRSTGECIAIYNACDGIPQCADGSDEAVELGCPDPLTTPPPNLAHANSPPQIRYDSNSNIAQAKINQLAPAVPPQNLYRPPLPQDNLPLANQEPDFIRPLNDPKNYNNRLQFDAQQYVPQGPAQGPPNWMPHQSNQMPMQMPQYIDKNSHIFNHKESGLQVPDGQEISKIQYPESVNNGLRDYPKIPNYYNDNNNFRQPIQQENWPIDETRYANNNNRYIDKNVQDQINNKVDQMQYKSISSAVQPIMGITDTSVNPVHVQDMMAHDLKHSKENMQHGESETKIKIETRPLVHHQKYPDVVAYKLTDDVEDGTAQTPRGAVLSLTLGLIITCIMAILIGCRLKMVRKRMRRGGKSYAHDADYLVNGMYL